MYESKTSNLKGEKGLAIKKPVIIVTSLGRTGTRFFSTLFSNIMSDCTSLHEPDILTIPQDQTKPKQIASILRQFRESGIYYLIIQKIIGNGGIIEFSDARVRGTLNHELAAQKTLDRRRNFVSSRPGSVYMESSIAYYGILDILPDVYQNHKAAYIVRDGRDWVKSWMNWGEGSGFYTKRRVKKIVAHTWPTACEVQDDPYGKQWDSMSRFSRLCWAWSRLNAHALTTIQMNPNARLFYFEDIFKADNRYDNLADMVNFLTKFPKCAPIETSPLTNWLERKIHKSSGEFPDWANWAGRERQIFKEICGPLMEKLGYG